MSNVHRVDARRAALEQQVGEPACRGANIHAHSASGVEVKGIERALQLEATSADKPGLAGGDCQLNGGIRGDRCSSFCHHLASDAHLTRHDERPRALSTWHKPTRRQ
jgi:hypothetical protein